MPKTTAFQKADRLALLLAISEFFALLEGYPCSEEATKLAFTIRRCEYEGNPADVKTLMYLLGWSKTKVIDLLKDLTGVFEFRTVPDEKDRRRSVQRLYGTESPATTEFFDQCLAVVDRLVLAREAAKKLKTDLDLTVQQPANDATKWKKAKVAAVAASALWLSGWIAFDTDKADDINRLSTAVFDHSIEELIEDPIEHFWNHADPEHYHDHLGPRARDTTVRFSQAGPRYSAGGRSVPVAKFDLNFAQAPDFD